VRARKGLSLGKLQEIAGVNFGVFLLNLYNFAKGNTPRDTPSKIFQFHQGGMPNEGGMVTFFKPRSHFLEKKSVIVLLK
jgi:hypothetical protein